MSRTQSTYFLPQKELLSFLDLHQLGSLLSLKLLARGIESTTYSLITSLGTFILTLLEDRSLNLPFLQKVSHFFAIKGFPLAHTFAIGTLAEKPAMISSHLKGKGKNEWSIEDYETVGFLLGNFHKHSETLPVDNLPPSTPFIWQLSSTFFEIQHHIPKEFYPLEQAIFFLEEVWPFDLPKGLIHGDLWTKNVLFSDDKVSGLIEFYPSYEPFVLDLANLLKGADNPTLSSAFLSAYEVARPLSFQESTYLNLCTFSKTVATTLYLLKKSLEIPSKKETFQTYAFLNLLKIQSIDPISLIS